MKRVRESHPYEHWVFQVFIVVGALVLLAKLVRGPTSWDVRLDTTYEAKPDRMGVLVKHKWWGVTEETYPIRFSVKENELGVWYYRKNDEWHHIPHGKYGRRVEVGAEGFSSDW